MQRVITKREKAILYITIAVVIFYIGFNLFIAPPLNKNELLNKEININRAKLKKYVRLLSQKDYIQNKYKQFTSRLNLSEVARDDLVTALSELGTFAKDTNIRIIDIRPQSPKTLDLYKEILIDLGTEGAMEGYFKFVYDIENSLSAFRIKKFQLTLKSNGQTLEGNFLISKISLPE